MPRGNGTGPVGMGPKTGRGAGYCTGHNTPGYAHSPGYGRGALHERGRTMRGAGFRGCGSFHGYHHPAAYSAPVDEKEFLNNQTSWLTIQLDAIQKRLAQLDEKD